MDFVYVVKMFGIAIESYLSEQEARNRIADLRAYQELLQKTVLHSNDHGIEFINSFLDENMDLTVEKIPIKGSNPLNKVCEMLSIGKFECDINPIACTQKDLRNCENCFFDSTHSTEEWIEFFKEIN